MDIGILGISDGLSGDCHGIGCNLSSSLDVSVVSSVYFSFIAM